MSALQAFWYSHSGRGSQYGLWSPVLVKLIQDPASRLSTLSPDITATVLQPYVIGQPFGIREWLESFVRTRWALWILVRLLSWFVGFAIDTLLTEFFMFQSVWDSFCQQLIVWPLQTSRHPCLVRIGLSPAFLFLIDKLTIFMALGSMAGQVVLLIDPARGCALYIRQCWKDLVRFMLCVHSYLMLQLLENPQNFLTRLMFNQVLQTNELLCSPTPSWKMAMTYFNLNLI